MEGQIIILTTLNPIKEIVRIESNFNGATSSNVLRLPIYLSPLMSIVDIKEYLVNELAGIVKIHGDVILWSPGANIEFNHPSKIFVPTQRNNEFMRSEYVVDEFIFEEGPIYVSGDIELLIRMKGDAVSPNDLQHLHIETFFSKLYSVANKIVMNHTVSYSNIFRSQFQALRCVVHLKQLKIKKHQTMCIVLIAI